MHHRIRRYLGLFFGVAALAAAGVIVHYFLKKYPLASIRNELRLIPPHRIAAAIVLTAASYLALTFYDTLGFRYIRHPLPYRRIALASFTGYAFSNNTGMAGVAGTSIRLRFYKAWGVTILEVAKVLAFNSVTLWTGFCMATGLFFLFWPAVIPESLPSPIRSTQPFAPLFLATAFGYLLLVRFFRRPIRIRRFYFRLPSPSLAIAQVAFSTINWMLGGSVLYVLFPPLPISYPAFISIFMLAVTTGVLSHIPGGLGVIELVMMAFLSRTLEPSRVFGTLVAYRCIYYILPLCVGAVTLGARELFHRRDRLAGPLRPAKERAG